jgi:hypothetical protein
MTTQMPPGTSKLENVSSAIQVLIYGMTISDGVYEGCFDENGREVGANSAFNGNSLPVQHGNHMVRFIPPPQPNSSIPIPRSLVC